MCVVHRIIKDNETGLAAAVRFELAPKKGVTISTRALLGRQSVILEEFSTFGEKQVKPVRRESCFERARRLENQRLIGAGSLPPAPEEHCLSPQFGGTNSRIKTAANSDQLSDREQRNKRTRTLGCYEHVTPAHTFVWNGVTELVEETRETRRIRKISWCDSHGKHGRKPMYKDRWARINESGKARVPTILLQDL